MDENTESTLSSSREEKIDENNIDLEKSDPSPRNLTVSKTALDWDGPNDPENPQNWSKLKKAYHILVPTILGFIVSLGTSIYSPSVESIAEKFSVSTEVSLVAFTTFVLGLAFGPVLGSPASEMYGRRPVYLISIPLFAIFTLGAGFAHNIQTVIICRFFSGLFGGPTLAVGAGTNADLYVPEKRAITTTIFTLSPFLATGLGPVIGAYVNAYKDWRWVEWTLIFFTLAGYLFSIFTHETYKKLILSHRAKHLNIPLTPGPSGMAFFKSIIGVALFRPIHMLLTEPIVLSFAIYVAFNFAVLFGFLSSIPLIFMHVYGFLPEQTGLPFLGIATGCVLSVPTMILIDTVLYQPLYRRAMAAGQKGVAPEYRLYGAMIGSLGLPIALFWFAWTSRQPTHWIVPIIALIPFSWGNICIFISCVLYMVDTYLAANGASAMAANGLLRYVAGATFPLFTVQMYNGMGFAWASSLLAFVTVGLLPVPWILFLWGEKIRARSGYTTWKP